MEISVWNQRRWFVLAVSIGLSLSTSLTAAPRPKNPILSQSAPKSVAASTLIFKTTPGQEKNVLRIQREAKTSGKTGESRFGVMGYEGKFIAYTLERESLKIPTGEYAGELRWSKRFEETVVYIHVPKRSGIEIHRGNCPADSGGCVLVGTAINGACLSNSKQALERTVKVLPQRFTVVVTETE